ncbi:GNAT family N-acetyltransferase [Micromonospora musae]|uniref:GNAT family N-acetyltransferase n=1 Tax=Micromonospora musae TaxID=1894970 RepID=UPI003411E5C8
MRSSADVTLRAVIRDGRLVGSIASFVMDGDTEVAYWIDRAVWGQGVAGQGIALFLETVPVRPLYARAASDDVRSLRVLRRAGSRSSARRSRTRTRGAPKLREPRCASVSHRVGALR